VAQIPTLGEAATEQQCIVEALDRGLEEPGVLCWQYSSPALVLGRGQRVWPELADRAARERVGIVRRASGGGAVMAGPWMLSLTLLLPASHPIARASLPAGYRLVGSACRRVLHRQRIPAELHDLPPFAPGAGSKYADTLGWACFATVSHGELVAGAGRKIVGLSQLRRRDAMAVCIGVLVGRPDWDALMRIWLGRDDPDLVRELERRTATCAEFLPTDGTGFAESLAGGLATELAEPRMAA